MMKKIVWPGILAGLAIFVIEMVVSWAAQMMSSAVFADYANLSIFRAKNDPLMSLFFLYPFVSGLLLSWVWAKAKGSVMGEGVWARGSRFGAVAWVAFTIPAMLITYASFNLSLSIILSWLIGGLVEYVVAGTIFAKLNA